MSLPADGQGKKTSRTCGKIANLHPSPTPPVVFDGIYKKLERELHEKKKEMAAIIEDSKNAYQLRDKSQVPHSGALTNYYTGQENKAKHTHRHTNHTCPDPNQPPLRLKNEMLSLKQQAEKEQAEFELEWKKLGTLMEKDRQLRESMRRKNPEEAPSLSDVVVGDTMGQTVSLSLASLGSTNVCIFRPSLAPPTRDLANPVTRTP